MVDLRVGQQHARDRRRAEGVDAPGSQPLKLLARVRRGVYEKPRPLGPPDRERRLRARSCARAHPSRFARIAMTVPLREAPTGGRAEDTNVHVLNEARRSLGPAPEATSASGSYR